MKQIITHDGQFHADEIFAIALLFEIIGEVPILRTRNIKIEDIENPETWMLDVGMYNDAVLHNFDHHQDSTLEATNMLVLRSLNASKHIKDELFDELFDKFKTISTIDKNGTANFNGFQVNSLIKSLNQLPNGWDLALNVARAVVKTAIESVRLIKVSKDIFNKGKFLMHSIIYCNEFPVHWKRYNVSNYLLVQETKKEDFYSPEWVLHTIDSVAFPLLKTGKETFFHNNRFLAKYATEEDAFEACRLLEKRDVGTVKTLKSINI